MPGGYVRLFRTKTGCVVERDWRYFNVDGADWDELLAQEDLKGALDALIEGRESTAGFHAAELLAPIGRQEVWAAGVTYYRSRGARMEESRDAGGGSFYDRVYSAERPELFFKSTASRTVGTGGSVRIRADAAWSVPEPELTLLVSPTGRITGYTIGNDMSSRDIEGENPLYLPQAKVYSGSCALGPGILVSSEPLAPSTVIAIEILREETPRGFVPNYARSGGWKSVDRSEPPVGAITVLGLYKKFHERWLLEETYMPLMKWNRWWAAHRDIEGYLAWGSDGDNQPADLDDSARGTRAGAILESGLDNRPMYDTTTYNAQSHVLEFADVGLMSMYIADCDALAEIADALGKTGDATELRDRGARYRAKLATLWDEHAGIFLNKDLHTGQSSMRLSPTNFYPMLAHAATPEQAKTMVEKHLLNTKEFWGEWVIPAIERDDAAFHDQDYWRGRIWGPMNYLVYLGLMNYDDAAARKEFAQKSYDLFLKEWKEKGHVHENYNAILGTGDDVSSSDRFYHWGALLGYVEYLDQGGERKATEAGR